MELIRCRYNQEHGITSFAGIGREVLMYKVDAVRGVVKEGVQLIADTILNPVFASNEILEAQVG